MAERRKFPRHKARLPVKFRIFDRENKTEITNDIDAYTQNISKTGMCLTLPRGWDCPDCNNCLGWMYNLSCKLKNTHNHETNRFITPKLSLKILVFDPSLPFREPLELEGDCVWVKQDVAAEEEAYPVGISLFQPFSHGFLGMSKKVH